MSEFIKSSISPLNTVMSSRSKKTSKSKSLIGKKNISIRNEPDYLEEYISYHSKMLNQPIINLTNYQNALDIQFPVPNKTKMELKILTYPIILETLHQCSSFSNSKRKYIYQYLYSLPYNKELYKEFASKGIHPFFRFLPNTYPLEDKNLSKQFQKLCSALAYYSIEVGNIYFLPDFVFPFCKCFPNENHFLFELLIAFISNICSYWFEYYPGCPLFHCKLGEKIIKHENINLYEKLKKIFIVTNKTNMKITELIWRFMKFLFSESLVKEHWLQCIDFLICFNYKPEMIIYLATAFILKNGNEIINCEETSESLNKILFEINPKITNLTSIFHSTLILYEKYNRYQLYNYKPYLPLMQKNSYNIKFSLLFPKDCIDGLKNILKDTAKMDKEYLKEKEKYNNDEKQLIKELLFEEEKTRRLKSLINKEQEKDRLMKHDLGNKINL